MNEQMPSETDIGQLAYFRTPRHQSADVDVFGSGPASHLLADSSLPDFLKQKVEISTLPALGSSEFYELSTRLDWAVITRLRGTVSELLTDSLNAHPGMDEPTRHELARAHVTDAIRAHVDDMVAHSGESVAWGSAMQGAAARAVFDSLFRLGRMQPLVDLPEVENVDIYGFDNVWVTFSDGTKKKHAQIADSDAELIAEIQFLASRGGEEGRSFTATSPILDMDLPGGARLAAVAPPISPRPKVVIRIHRFVDITLNDLVVTHHTLSHAAANFLDASVKAGKSIVASGSPGAGKTTLIRALASSIDPHEKIVTIEKERELYLDKMGDRHLIVTPLQYRPGQGERLSDGSKPGEVTLVELLEEALRLDSQRIIVGEVRGGEIDAMFQAMQAGVGSLSTLHANSPTDAIERMATLTQKSLNTSDTYAYRQIAQHIDLVLQIRQVTDHAAGGRRRRIVTEISQIQTGETADGSRPIAAPIFRADPHTLELLAVGRPTQALLDELTRMGFDPDELVRREVA